MKKNWKDLSFEDKGLVMRQIAEGGYGWNWSGYDYKMDWLENLRIGYESDSEWFSQVFEDDDWSGIFEAFAQELAEEISSDEYDMNIDDFENRHGEVSEVAAKYILSWHEQGLEFTREDVIFTIEDLSTK